VHNFSISKWVAAELWFMHLVSCSSIAAVLHAIMVRSPCRTTLYLAAEALGIVKLLLVL
jgi:hypothetical protein